MTSSALRRFAARAFVILALACLSSCAVPLAPGYRIEKQSITVHFIPGNPPHLAIRADYRLQNTGNQPLDSIETGLPGGKGFGRENLRAQIDGRPAALRRVHNQTSEPGESESTVSEMWPTFWRISFGSRWPRGARRDIRIEYDLAAQATTDPRISVSPTAFDLSDSGWFPDLLTPKALFAKDVARPDPSALIVDVPVDFVATASGKRQSAKKHSAKIEYRFRLQKYDFDPYVAAGAYQQQRITNADGHVVFWTFHPISDSQAQSTAAKIAAAAAFYAQTFGPLPKSMKAIHDIELPGNVATTDTNPDAADASILPGVVHDWVLNPGKSFSTGPRNGFPGSGGRTELAYTWFGHMIVPRPQAWTLGDALAAYASEVQNEKNNTGISRNGAIVSNLEDYDLERAKAVEKPISSLIPGDPKAQLRIGADKSLLFLFALEDKCGRENVERALAHMDYALRGENYGYTDLRAALEQECHQHLANFFTTWLDHTGIPPGFRARYASQEKNKH